MNWLLENPVFVKEMRARLRLRTTRPVVTLALCVAVLVVLWFYYETLHYLQQDGRESRVFWDAGVTLHALVIWLIAPGLTANAITQEREQQTWEMLLFTRLTEGEVVLGKVAARALPLLGLGLLAAPPMLAAALTGGVSLSAVLAAYACMLVWTAFGLTAGLVCSWGFRSTVPATVAVYTFVTVLVVGTAVLEEAVGAMFGRSTDTYVTWLNPVRVASALVGGSEQAGGAEVIVVSSLAYLAGAAAMVALLRKRLRHPVGAP